MGTGLNTAVTDLLATVEKFCAFLTSNTDVEILLYIDEAHELAISIPNSGKKLFDIVWSTLYKFETASIFTVFLSTQSSLSLLAPFAEAAQSSQQQDIEVLWGPITETPFDCHKSFPLESGEYFLPDIQGLEFLMRFGRPLYVMCYGSSKLTFSKPLSQVLDHAQ